jgi:hypothetical protein
MTRLETLLPKLADKLRRAPAAKQRAASLAASEFAISHARVENPLVEVALEKVRAAGLLTPEEKAEMEALTAQLDEQYFALQEAAEEGQGGAESCLQLFGQARAVASLSFAGDRDAFKAATEAIYEAAATTDDKDELSACILSALE